MTDQAKFEQELFKPLAAMIGLCFLVAAVDIALLLWAFFTGNFHSWQYPIMIGGFCVTQALLVGWFLWVGARRAKADAGVAPPLEDVNI